MSGKNKPIILIAFASFTFIALSLLSPDYSYAETFKDADLDGVTDDAEINIYHTNPNNSDTDGDGVLDFAEILDKTDPIDPNSSLLKETNPEKLPLITNKDPVVWMIGRASGIAAFILFSIVVSFGLFMSSKSFFKFKILSNPTAFETHKTLALVALMLVAVHFSSFFFDSFLKLSIFDALVPFKVNSPLISARGVSLNNSIPFGIFAFYLGSVLVVTSYFRNKIVSTKIWRLIHYSTFVFYILFMIHGYFGGTDSNEFWMKVLYSVSLSFFLFFLVLRIFAKKLFYPKPVVKPTTNTTATPEKL